MNATAMILGSKRKRPRSSVPLAADKSQETKRLAAVILEVLAGVRTPTDAAAALQISVPRYYQLEVRALRGLLQACVAKPKGRQPAADHVETALRRENEHLRREVSRQQTLVRVTQRHMGLPAPPAKAATKKGRKRRPTVRALQLAERLRREAETAAVGMEMPAVALAAADS